MDPDDMTPDIPPWMRGKEDVDDERPETAVKRSQVFNLPTDLAVIGTILFGTLTHQWLVTAVIGMFVSFAVGARVGARWARESDRLDADVARLRSLPGTGGEGHEPRPR